MSTKTQAVFSYWTGIDQTAHNDFINDWTSEFPQFQLFGDDEVRPLIERYFPDKLEVYDDIRIPTAKSDIALLILLYNFGGLYIDCHSGIVRAGEIKTLLSSLLEYDAIFVDRKLSQEPRDQEEHLVINSIILCRPRFDLMLKMCRQALQNFARQRNKEERRGFVAYDIWSLSGPGLVTAMLLEPGSFNCDVRQEYEGRIKIIREEGAPIERNRYRAYRVPGQHWSERQTVELLFGRSKENTYGQRPEELALALAAVERPDLLRRLVGTSRRAFGFVTTHYPHNFNYSWTAARLERLPAGSRMLDFGAGISPLPLYFAERGMFVDCVDNSDIVRVLPASEEWNEWGFFEYGTLHKNLAAYNCSIVEFIPMHSYDVIYSVCAVAHFPSSIRRQALKNCWECLKPGGILVLLIDLIPGSNNIWNHGGSEEETPEQHGTYHDLETEIETLGFVITDFRVQRRVVNSRTDLYYSVSKKLG